jgi:hypothetical protein
MAAGVGVTLEGGCPHCGTRYESWSRLEFLESVSPERIRSLVTSWDSGQRIEVRRCPRCGAALARFSTVEGGPGPQLPHESSR